MQRLTTATEELGRKEKELQAALEAGPALEKEHADASAASKAELEAAKEEHAASLQSTVDEKDAAISASEGKVAELEAVVAELKRASAEKGAELESAKAEAASLQESQSWRESHAQQLECELAALREGQKRDKDEVAALKTQHADALTAKDAAMAELQAAHERNRGASEEEREHLRELAQLSDAKRQQSEAKVSEVLDEINRVRAAAAAHHKQCDVNESDLLKQVGCCH